jgi:hypothetical protein
MQYSMAMFLGRVSSPPVADVVSVCGFTGKLPAAKLPVAALPLAVTVCV